LASLRDKKDMKIGVTGGCGRLGKAVIELALVKNHEVVNLDRVPLGERPRRAGVEEQEVDLTDYGAFEEALAGCEALIHLAAIPSPRQHPAHVVHNNNVLSNYNGLCAAVNLGIRPVCLASSINATGAFYSREPRFDYFPLDEGHPTYNEDAYSLSKWIGELQADSIARRHEEMKISSLRLHGLGPGRPPPGNLDDERSYGAAKQLWGYTSMEAAARACLLSLTADFSGHEVFYIVAPETMMTVPSLELKARYYPDVPVRGDLSGYRGFFNCEKAARLLGWQHEPEEEDAHSTTV
jgi:UDP-glucose 4-epimerase